MITNNINLFFSHEVEQLAQQLLTHVSKEVRCSNNPLIPAHVIVPNANMQRYLQLYMAEKQGVCANLEFPFLEKGLSQYLNLFEKNKELTVWSQADLALKIYAFLSTSELIIDPVMQPIKQYLNNQLIDSQGNDVEVNELLASRKKWQLSQRLATLFVSYELQRPEMVMKWLLGRPFFQHSQDQQLKDIETAERFIYQTIMQSNEQTGGHSLFQRFQLIDWSQAAQSNKGLHLFTPTRLSAFHRHFLAHLAQFLPVNIYQLNVCNEYWEDMSTDREDAWLKALKSQPINAYDAAGEVLTELTDEKEEVFFELSDEGPENPLLKAWGKPGRESLRLFSELEDDAIHLNVVFEPDWLYGTQTRNHKALHVIQEAILNREQPQKILNDTTQLTTLQMAVAPSIYREVQAVYNNILANLKSNDQLKLTDIAILVPDMNKYRCVIEQVFTEQNNEHPFQLRYSLIDSSVKTESLYAQAVLGLFDVLEQDLMRAAVLKWLANDCVKQALSISNDDLAEWLSWLNKLGVYSHFNHLYDSKNEGEVSRRFTWQQGLRRLRQSLVSDDALSLSQDNELMGKLTWLIEKLNHWNQVLKTPRYPKDWLQLITQMTMNFVAIPEDLGREEQVRLALNTSLNNLVEHAGQVLMTLADIRYFIEQEFTHLSASKGNYLSGGLICASLQPMRPIPFKITYIMGLDERSFPGELYQETLDLTQRSRRLGDINKIENMNYLFLETLMCSREKLYLSYVGHNLIKDEVVQPSSTWQQLHEFATTLIDQDSLSLKSYPISQIPLDSAQLVHNEALDAEWLVNFSDIDHQKLEARNDYINQANKQSDRLANDERHQSIESDQKTEVVTNIQVQSLVKFIENPVLSYLEQVGASSQLIDDLVNIEHEPLHLDGLLRYQLFDAAIHDYLLALSQDKPISLTTAIDAQYDQRSQQSQLPIHLFAELDKLYELEQHQSFIEFQTEFKTLKALPGPIVFGNGLNRVNAAQQLKALSLNGSEHQFIVHGTWEGLYSLDGMITQQVVVTSSKAANWSKVLIKPFLYWCMAQLDEQIQIAENFQLCVVFRDQVKRYTFKPWSTGEVSFSSRSEIKAYLLQLFEAFNDPKPVNLPFEVISGLKVAVNDREQLIPYLSKKSVAKSAHVFAYDELELSQFELTHIQKTYQEKSDTWLNIHNYYEILKALKIQFDPDALSTYRERLMPLHVMVEVKLP